MTLTELLWLGAFFASLALVLAASDRLVIAVEAAGDRYGWSPGIVGLLAAAGADGPEVSAAIFALAAGQHEVSLGVILGSNLFNLAALLGLPILFLGWVAVQRHSVLVNGSALFIITLLTSLLVLGVAPLALTELLILATLVGYALLLTMPSAALQAHTPALPEALPLEPGDSDTEEREREREADRAAGFPSGKRLAFQALLATAVLIAGCDVLVNATLYLGPRLGLPSTIIGTFGLAALTSLPNVWVAVSLVRRHRGGVLVSAVCNSNTINCVFGICVPALFTSLHTSSVVRQIDIPALLIITTLSLVLVWRGHGLGRPWAFLLVAAYAAFTVTRLILAPGLGG